MSDNKTEHSTSDDCRAMMAAARKMMAIMDLAHDPNGFENELGYEWAWRVAEAVGPTVQSARAALGLGALHLRGGDPATVAAEIAHLAIRASRNAGGGACDAHPFAEVVETLVEGAR